MGSGRLATLIVNPAAGRAGRLRRELPDLAALLGRHGYQANVLYTTAEPHSGRELARGSLGSALVIACGGDGTVHDVVQVLAGSGVPLGVLPLGTANALARNLALPLRPVAALARLLTYTPQAIPLGELSTAAGTRLFTVMAGCGPDGALAHTLPAGLKRGLGRAGYYVHAARLFATRRWPAFRVDYQLPGDPSWHTTSAVAMLAARVADLGGLFTGLTPLATLTSPTLQVQLLRAPGHVSFAAWFALGRVGWRSPLLTTLEVAALRSMPLTAAPVYAQADAEPAGTLPLALRILPGALRLLMPGAASAGP